jgi:hypothetical protein
MKKFILLTVSHIAIAFVGFAAGIYFLPIIIAPEAPSQSEVQAMAANADFSGEFVRDLAGSDGLHWGEGKVFIGKTVITLDGSLAPGPDYKLYLSPEFVQTEADFIRLKGQMVRVGDIKTFDNFAINVPSSISAADYSAVIIWCETFGEFISAARYQ